MGKSKKQDKMCESCLMSIAQAAGGMLVIFLGAMVFVMVFGVLVDMVTGFDLLKHIHHFFGNP